MERPSPAALLAISDMPPVLWYRGSPDALRAPAVAVVGSRAATAVAFETAARLGTDLAALGITVVSSLARGVDSSAHRGAIRSAQASIVSIRTNTQRSPRRPRARVS